jgi:hypothetical protein
MRGFRSLRAQPSDLMFTSFAVPHRGGLGTRHSKEFYQFYFAVKKKRNPGSGRCFCGLIQRFD